jgi:hypothetical protein
MTNISDLECCNTFDQTYKFRLTTAQKNWIRKQTNASQILRDAIVEKINLEKNNAVGERHEN